jgi:imidazole glycerol-phosphate synthase subunit HisF
MLETRIIPTLLLRNASLVKTVKFGKYDYIGDPANTVRIFNELEVDELIFLDITASVEKRGPNLKVLREICEECFMPLAYGGGIRDLNMAEKIFKMGFEKIAINSYAFENPNFITQLADSFGSQAIIGSIDVRKSFWGEQQVYGIAGKKNMKKNPAEWAIELEKFGAGEILITSIDNEGSWEGFDYELVKQITKAVTIPVIAHGGAGRIDHIRKVVNEAGASAVAIGSMVVYQKKKMGVLVNFPDKHELRTNLKK